MPQKTIKIPVEPIQNEILRNILEKEGFEFKNHQYAYYRAQNKKVTVILYENQNLLIQGEDVEVDRFFHFVREKLTLNRVETGVLGLDESGKGDLFGPLVLAGAIINEDDGFIEKIGVDDSKNLSDERIKKIFNQLGNRVIYKVRIIEPKEYNRLYREYGNLNRLMVGEYKRLIKEFDEKFYKKIVLDKFSISKLQIEELKEGLNKPIEIYAKAERNPCVALASIIARYHFLEWFEKNNLPLVKGCNEESLSLKATLNPAILPELIKLHFKV